MARTASTASPVRTTPDFDARYERLLEQRAQLRTRHSQALSRLMDERTDLRGVNALADFVDDYLRWTA